MPLLVYLMEARAEHSAQFDYDKLSKQFGMETPRLREFVDRFRRLGLLKIAADGRFHVLFDRINHKQLQKRYMKRLLAEASRRIDSDYENRASAFVNYTLATNAESLGRLREDLQTLMDRYLAESPPASSPRQIAQVCFQLFTVARY